MIKNKPSLFLLFAVVIMVIFYIVHSQWRIAYEIDLDINFEVTEVEITPAFRAILCDRDGNKLSLQRCVFYDYHKIKPGDVVVKQAGSEVLKVYRKDSLGNKTVYLQMDLK